MKFYFASGKADVAAGGTQALSKIIEGVIGGKKAIVGNYHDARATPRKMSS